MTLPRLMSLLTFAVLGAFFVGCGTKYQPVTGEIVFLDGTPAKALNGGQIVFQKVGAGTTGEGTNPAGPIDADGKFSLGTVQPNDGAMEGEYLYAITRPTATGDEQLPKVIAEKHTKFDDTQKLTVKKGANHFKVQVEPFK